LGLLLLPLLGRKIVIVVVVGGGGTTLQVFGLDRHGFGARLGS
jgi:hypothetical protein